MTPNHSRNAEQNLQNVANTIYRPRGDDDHGPDATTNPGKSLLLNPNPKTGMKAFHPKANCANNIG